MFEKFGEMSSAEEINELAKNLLAEGDLESLKAMAEENGISEDYVEFFASGETPVLCDALDAAWGKIDVESAAIKGTMVGLMVDWVEYIKGQITENEAVAMAVRKKGKSLVGCIAALMDWSFNHASEVPKEIKEASSVSSVKKAPKITFGVPGMAEARKIIRNYYLG